MGKYGFSLEKKVKRIAACAGAVVFFSMSANLLITWFGQFEKVTQKVWLSGQP